MALISTLLSLAVMLLLVAAIVLVISRSSNQNFLPLDDDAIEPAFSLPSSDELKTSAGLDALRGKVASVCYNSCTLRREHSNGSVMTEESFLIDINGAIHTIARNRYQEGYRKPEIEDHARWMAEVLDVEFVF